MTLSTDALIVFVKNKEVGHVKTRLAKTIGDEAALSVYAQLLEILKKNIAGISARVWIYYSQSINQMDEWPGISLTKEVQSGKDLGKKMSQAIKMVKKHASKVIIIGSDCPQLDKSMIAEAFKVLDDYDVVVGPSKDGGYYLLGLRKWDQELFSNITWSSSTVLLETLERAKQLNLSVYLLTELRDLDDAEDYQHFLEKGILIGS